MKQDAIEQIIKSNMRGNGEFGTAQKYGFEVPRQGNGYASDDKYIITLINLSENPCVIKPFSREEREHHWASICTGPSKETPIDCLLTVQNSDFFDGQYIRFAAFLSDGRFMYGSKHRPGTSWDKSICQEFEEKDSFVTEIRQEMGTAYESVLERIENHNVPENYRNVMRTILNGADA